MSEAKHGSAEDSIKSARGAREDLDGLPDLRFRERLLEVRAIQLRQKVSRLRGERAARHEDDSSSVVRRDVRQSIVELDSPFPERGAAGASVPRLARRRLAESVRSRRTLSARRPKGDGKYGQADRAGNVWEWTLDWENPNVSDCIDCTTTLLGTTGWSAYKVFRDGASDRDAQLVLSSAHLGDLPTKNEYSGGSGARCAYAP
jgi:hypothetical protein